MAVLEVSVPIAYELLGQCIKQGQALVQRASLVGDFSDYESWKAARNQWIEPTVQALEHMYAGRSQGGEFVQTMTVSAAPQSWQQQYAADLDAVKSAIELLGVLQSELAFARDDIAPPPRAAQLEAQTPSPQQLDDARDRSAPAAPPAPAHEHEAEAEAEAEREYEHESASPLGLAGADRPEPAREEPPERQAAESARERNEPLDRLDDRPAVGAELAHAPSIAASLTAAAGEELSAERASAPSPAPARQVLLAHGRNKRWLEAVARLLEHAGTHEVTILNERIGERGELAEQFGEHAPGSRYAVVLLTADDIGAARVDSEDEPYYSPRAHQAVVFEMGFLVAALEPGRVCVLYEEGVQLPCEMQDITYVRLDMAGTWQPKLLLQLRRAGFDYDLNKLAAA
jgi:predicted nucleotide-binding protein